VIDVRGLAYLESGATVRKRNIAPRDSPVREVRGEKGPDRLDGGQEACKFIGPGANRRLLCPLLPPVFSLKAELCTVVPFLLPPTPGQDPER
jgi:hypothetical protein